MSPSHSVPHHYEGIRQLMLCGPAGSWTFSLTSTDARPNQMSYSEHRKKKGSPSVCAAAAIYTSASAVLTVSVRSAGTGSSDHPPSLVHRCDGRWTELSRFISRSHLNRALVHINRATAYWKQTHALAVLIITKRSVLRQRCTEASTRAAALSARHKTPWRLRVHISVTKNPRFVCLHSSNMRSNA